MSNHLYTPIKQYKYYFITVVLLACATAITNTSFGLMLKWLTDGLQNNDPNILFAFVILFSLQRFLLPLLGGGGTLASTMLANKIESDIRRVWYEHVVNLGHDHSHSKNSGEVQKKLQEAVNSVRTLLNGTMRSTLSIALEITSIVIFATLFISNGAGLALLFFAFIYALFIIHVTKKRMPIMQEIVRADGECAAFMHDSFINTGIISPEARTSRLKQHNNLLSNLESQKNVNSKKLFGDSAASAIICAIVSYGVLIFYYDKGAVSVGVVVMLATGLAQMISQINMLGFNFRNILRAKIDLARISEALKPKVEQDNGKTQFNFKDVYRFSFRSLKISSTGPATALGDITLNIGKINILRGPSGVGKSSIARIMRGEVQAIESTAYLNNIDLSTIDSNLLLNKVSLVSQDTIIFNESIAQNLRYGKSEASQEEIKATLLSVGLVKFVDNLEYVVGEKGGLLSGGEKKRLVIARGLLQKCEILILDEPFSGLDESSSVELASLISSLARSVCVFVIMHQRPTDLFKHEGIINEYIMSDEHGVLTIKNRTPNAAIN